MKQLSFKIQWHWSLVIIITIFHLFLLNNAKAQISLDSIIHLSHQGRFSTAEELFNKIDPNLTNEIEVLSARAYNYSWWQKYSQSTQLFNEILKLSPDHSDALLGLAYNLRYSKDYAKSNHFFNKLIEIQGEDLNALKGLTYNYLDGDQLYGAEYHLKKAISIAPDDSELYYLQGLIEYKKQNISKARKAFERSLEIDRNYDPAKDQLSRMINHSSRLEITTWYGKNFNKEVSKIGLRRLDVLYTLTNEVSIIGFWDNSMSFENNFLIQNSLNAYQIGLGSNIKWNNTTNTNLFISHWTIPASTNIKDFRIEQNIFITPRWRFQGGGQFLFDTELRNRVLAVTNEYIFNNHFQIEASLFNTHNEQDNSDYNTYVIVPKVYLSRNIEILAGLIWQENELESLNQGIKWRGLYTMTSFPIFKQIFSRVLFISQKQIQGRNNTIALGLHIKI